jgi:hypothetical protein
MYGRHLLYLLRGFEYKVLKHFSNWPYARRHSGSKGVADLVAIRPSQILFIQCKAGDKVKNGREELVRLAADCRAVPLCATTSNHRLRLIDLRYDEDFIPS